jgi:hypothetical protein
MTWEGRLAKEIYRKASAKGLFVGAEAGLTEANRTIPIEEGVMERSGETSVDDRKLEAAISYDTPYARRQHEDLSLRHDKGRRAKWLEQMLKEEGSNLRKVIGDEMKRNVP